MIRNDPSIHRGDLTAPAQAARPPRQASAVVPSADEIAWLLTVVDEDRAECAPYFHRGGDRGRP